ncbi:MAG: PHP domain-containing protein [Candidatus Omnitrophota bacterium]
MKFADLHLHTIFSDGTYAPDELVNESSNSALAAIAVTDHDTVCGVEPAIKAAGEKGIEVLSGIELTVEHDGKEVHLLGYLIDYKNTNLLDMLDILKENRIERIYRITDRLKDMGLRFNADSVFDVAGDGTVGRLHVARAMVNEGLIGSTAEAFRKYIGDKCPAYVCGFRLPPIEAIGLIKGAGGIPVLAHPHTLDSDELIPELVGYGLMGLEVYYPEYTRTMINFYLNLAKKYDLLVTGGSDCHGNAKPEVKVGSVKIPYELVVKLKAAQNRI